MAEFGISMDGRAPIADIPNQARTAEAGGASTLWIACHLYLRDPVTMAALALGATRRIKVALMAMSPYSLHPVFIAMAAASLEEMYPGRVILCLGVGAPADLKAAGIAAPRPLKTLGEAIAICRSLLAGEMTDFHGEVFGVSGRRLANGARNVPIVLAASRPNMLRLAGRATDGVLISAATSPPFVKACLERGRIRGGRPAVPQARHRLHQVGRHGEARHRSDPPSDRLRAARRPPCREHPIVRRQTRPGGAGGRLCRRELA